MFCSKTEKFFKKQFGSQIQWIKVGYTGGSAKKPSYEDVCTGQTGHAEVKKLKTRRPKILRDN